MRFARSWLASAAVSPDLIAAMDPSGAPLDSGQMATLAALATLAGGGAAGLAGGNVQAGATWAQNEALNNGAPHAAAAAQANSFWTNLVNGVTYATSTFAPTDTPIPGSGLAPQYLPYLVAGGALTAGAVLAGPEILAGCAANPVLCANEAAIVGSEVLAGVNGMPGTGASVVAGTVAEDAGNGTAGSIRNVNPGYPQVGRTQNCVNCVIATNATLAGNPASALPSAGPQLISVLEQQFGALFSKATTAANIEQQLLASGSGAQGIVFGSRGPGETGHVFNVVNQNGTIRFLDGQTGTAANLTGYTNLYLLKTN